MGKLIFNGDGVANRDGQKMCSYCGKVPVYGVPACVPCLWKLGTEVYASIIVYPSHDHLAGAVRNLELVIEELEKYGISAPERWIQVVIQDVVGRKKRSYKKRTSDRDLDGGKRAVYVSDGRCHLNVE